MADWRLTGQGEHLSGITLSKRTWRRPREDWDHDHCAFCSAKFSDSEDDLHEGYTTADEYHWICENCYDDFKEQFKWQVRDGLS